MISDNLPEAIKEAMVELGGAASVSKVKEWLAQHYPGRWKEISVSIAMADLAFPGNLSSRYASHEKFLERIEPGRYQLRFHNNNLVRKDTPNVYIFPDTNILIDNPSVIDLIIDKGYIVVIPLTVLGELDKLKNRDKLSYSAREALRKLEDKYKDRQDKLIFTVDFIEHPALNLKIPDEQILASAAFYIKKGMPVILLTNDRALRLKSIPFKITTSNLSELEANIKRTISSKQKIIDYERKISSNSFFTSVVGMAQEILGLGFSPKENKSGVTFFGSKGRILMVKTNKTFAHIEFNAPVMPVPGVNILSEKESREKSMGTCRWIYKGTDLKTVEQLIREAKDNYYK